MSGGSCSALSGSMAQKCSQGAASSSGVSVVVGAVCQLLALFLAGAACQPGVFAPPSPLWCFPAATKGTQGDPGVGLKPPSSEKLIILPFCRRKAAPTIEP